VRASSPHEAKRNAGAADPDFAPLFRATLANFYYIE
jgi:hypothetical protein